MPQKWKRREKKIKNRKNRMPKHGMSLFVIEEIIQKKAEKARKKKEKSGNV